MTQCLVSQDELQVLLRRDPVGEDDDLTVAEGVASSVSAIEVTLRAGSHGLCVQLREPCLEVSLVADNRQLRRTCQLAHEVASDQLHPTGCDPSDRLAVQIDDVVDGVPVSQREAAGLDEQGTLRGPRRVGEVVGFGVLSQQRAVLAKCGVWVFLSDLGHKVSEALLPVSLGWCARIDRSD